MGLSLGILLTGAMAESDESENSVDAGIPLLLEYERDDDSKEVEILDLGIIEGYRYERHGDHKEVEILDLPLAAVLKAERNEEGETGFRFIHVPFITVAERDLGKHGNSFKLLDVPFFSLVKTENDDDGDFDRQLIDLPILGPLFRHKRVGDKETTRFLFFKHSRTSNDDESDEPRRTPRRSNAHPG
jgi:hypothetical protein